LCKLFLTNLYGKFGQSGRKFEQIGKVKDDKISNWVEWDADSKSVHRYRQFAGVVEELQRDAESRESFPAIAGHITSASRLLLFDYISQAGKGNTFYTDTDSLFLSDAGFSAIRGSISEDQLGYLKHEWSSEEVTLHGVKDYQREGRTKRKGIRATATQLDASTFQQDQFRGLKGMIQAEDLNHLHIKNVTKHLGRVYAKGRIDSAGVVHPLVFPHLDFPDP
jgi:hypothetical protein